MATIGENLKKFRLKLGITQEELSKKSGVKYSTLIKVEADIVTKPTVHTVAKIAKALGVSIEDLL